ncbi:hypothetical protein [Siccirubricoccus phaeus]|uniref:hypothetical protein n=1 Tax=Siccirubricoccus phaeus TaxID=2595053 RepID=UPI0011F0D410|nr:hypothetical protein [Siccirubricoccus phaeus]
MSHEQYDDGLVHPHRWAREPMPKRPGPVTRQAELAEAMDQHPEEAEGFDEGLVHGHDWASAERSRMAG